MDYSRLIIQLDQLMRLSAFSFPWFLTWWSSKRCPICQTYKCQNKEMFVSNTLHYQGLLHLHH